MLYFQFVSVSHLVPVCVLLRSPFLLVVLSPQIFSPYSQCLLPPLKKKKKNQIGFVPHFCTPTFNVLSKLQPSVQHSSPLLGDLDILVLKLQGKYTCTSPCTARRRGSSCGSDTEHWNAAALKREPQVGLSKLLKRRKRTAGISKSSDACRSTSTSAAAVSHRL